MKPIIIVILLMISASCNLQKNIPFFGKGKDNQQIRFDFTVNSIGKNIAEVLEIKASLFNNDDDTLYFLSTSCNGELYLLRYDTTRFIILPQRVCEVNYPVIKRIPPKSIHEFTFTIACANLPSEDETDIKLLFNMFPVDKSYDISKITLKDLYNKIIDQNENIILRAEKKVKIKHRVNSKPVKCPECNSEKIADILYGLPNFSKELKKDIEEKKVVLGGCLVTGDDPKWKCMECGRYYYKTR